MVTQRIGCQLALGHEAGTGVVQCNPGAGNRSAARTAVGLKHVAIERDLALAEGHEIGNRAQRSTDQALYLLGPTRLLTLGRFARRARVRRARQHAVLGRYPAASPTAQEGRYGFLDAGGAQHAGIAHGDQYRSLGVAGKVAHDAHIAQLRGVTLAGSHGSPISNISGWWNGFPEWLARFRRRSARFCNSDCGRIRRDGWLPRRAAWFACG